MREDAPAVLVVQDNYYKDMHNDTAKILSEMAVAVGFESADSPRLPRNSEPGQHEPSHPAVPHDGLGC